MGNQQPSRRKAEGSETRSQDRRGEAASKHRTSWNSKYASCIRCGTTDTRHMAKGLCRRCYLSEYNERNADRVREHKRRWYERNMTPETQKQDREQRHFAGLRDQVLERDGYRCVQCGTGEQLVVHHADGEGRGSDSPNNVLDNLQTLCRSCHATVHHTISRWARGYDSCCSCGRSDRKHNAHGLCVACYSTAAYNGRLDEIVRSQRKR